MAKITIFRHVANGRQGSPRFKGLFYHNTCRVNRAIERKKQILGHPNQHTCNNGNIHLKCIEAYKISKYVLKNLISITRHNLPHHLPHHPLQCHNLHHHPLQCHSLPHHPLQCPLHKRTLRLWESARRAPLAPVP